MQVYIVIPYKKKADMFRNKKNSLGNFLECRKNYAKKNLIGGILS